MKKLITLLLIAVLAITTQAQVYVTDWDLSELSIGSNETYLLKRGETYTGSIQISDKQNVTIGAYGTGDMPQINGNGAGNVIHVLGSNNILIKDLEIYNPNYEGSGVRLQATATDDVWNVTIRNCKIHKTSNGIRAVSNSGSWIIYDVTIAGCEIHDIEEDGIFGNYEHTFVCDSNYIYKVNMGWHTIPGGHSQTVSGGDGIQIGFPDVYYLRHNVIDRRYTGNKFCFILGASSDYTIGYIENNVFYPPKHTPDCNGGTALYIFDSEEVYIKNNIFSGRACIEGNTGAILGAGQMHVYNECVVEGNIFDSIVAMQFTNKLTSLKFSNNTQISPFGMADQMMMQTQGGNSRVWDNCFSNCVLDGPTVYEEANLYYTSSGYNDLDSYYQFQNSRDLNYTPYSNSILCSAGVDGGTIGAKECEGSTPECATGDTRCEGFDLYECISGTWTLIESNSESCGYVPQVPCRDPYADFIWENKGPDRLGRIRILLTNLSCGSPTAYEWHCPGAVKETSTTKNFTANYLTVGTYTVKLKVTNNCGGFDEFEQSLLIEE